MFDDIIRRVVVSGHVPIKNRQFIKKISVFGVSLDIGSGGLEPLSHIPIVNFASDLLSTVLSPEFDRGRRWIIIIDEFDQLKNRETIDFFTALIKQLSVDGVPIKFAFCGVASNLNDLIGSHESSDRYIDSVELKPLAYDDISKIAKGIFANFDLSLSRGQEWRLTQIACGYPHFAHLICKEILILAYEEKFKEKQVSPELYKLGVQRASERAATRLRSAYEKAAMKGTDKYIEVLWAAADGQHLEKQFETIAEDYRQIMSTLSHRVGLDTDQDICNYLNSLCRESHGSALSKRNPGWYRFTDPMLRSYIRMLAHRDGVELGDESFKD